MKTSKRHKESVAKIELEKNRTTEEAVVRIKETTSAKFVESVDIAVRLGVDPKKAYHAFRGTVSLPH